eukprot:829934-Prymnesium_polylepis.1
MPVRDTTSEVGSTNATAQRRNLWRRNLVASTCSLLMGTDCAACSPADRTRCAGAHCRDEAGSRRAR